MSVTLDNAVAVIGYQATVPAGGYWRTRHHAEHIEAGDLVRPLTDQYPRRVDSIRISRGVTHPVEAVLIVDEQPSSSARTAAFAVFHDTPRPSATRAMLTC